MRKYLLCTVHDYFILIFVLKKSGKFSFY